MIPTIELDGLEMHTLLRRCSWGIPETIPISPGLAASTNASEENGRHRGAKVVRRERPWLAARRRLFAIIDEPLFLCLGESRFHLRQYTWKWNRKHRKRIAVYGWNYGFTPCYLWYYNNVLNYYFSYFCLQSSYQERVLKLPEIFYFVLKIKYLNWRLWQSNFSYYKKMVIIMNSNIRDYIILSTRSNTIDRQLNLLNILTKVCFLTKCKKKNLVKKDCIHISLTYTKNLYIILGRQKLQIF